MRSVCGTVLLLVVGCGAQSDPGTGSAVGTLRGSVINGTIDGDLHPNVGALARPFPNAGDPFGARCSGVLVHKRVFLTAAHCAVNLANLGYGDHGSFGVSFEPEITPTSKFYYGTLHPDPTFLVDPLIADVGVVLLDEEVKGIKPAKLPSKDFLDSLSPEQRQALVLTGVGYGSPTDALEPRGVRRYSTHPLIDLFGADELGYDFDNYVILGGPFADGYGTSSFGDSGGPHFLGDRVVAITSFTNFGTESSGLEFAQRVDLARFRDFIKSFFGEHSEFDE